MELSAVQVPKNQWNCWNLVHYVQVLFIKLSSFTTLNVGEVVERVEDAEHVHAVLHGELAELLHDVVGVRGVADGVGAPQQHLGF